MPTRVHYRHDNPAYLRPAFTVGSIEVPEELMPAEGDVEEFDDFLTDDFNEAEEECSQLHWKDEDFKILRSEYLTLGAMNA